MKLEILSERLKAARKAHKFAQKEIAKRLEITPQYLSMIEKKHAEKISAALHHRMEALLVSLESTIDQAPAEVITIANSVRGTDEYHPAPECVDAVN